MGLYLRGSIWYMDFSVKGRRIHESTRTADERLAAKIMKGEREKALLSTSQPKRFKMSLKDAIEYTYRNRWVQSKDGLRSRQRALEIASIIGLNKDVAEVDTEAVRTAALKLRARDTVKTEATVNRYLANLRTVLKYVTKGKDMKVPTFELTKEKGKHRKCYTVQEEKLILDTFKAQGRHDMHDLTVTLVDTGMRLSEALMLQQQWARFPENVIILPDSVTKSGEPREIPMSARVRSIMMQRAIKHSHEKVFNFCNIHQVEYLWNKMKTAIGKQGNKQWVIHSLRHTCATRLIQAGTPIFDVQKWLGHEVIDTTLRYTHHDAKQLQKYVSAIDYVGKSVVEESENITH